MKHKNVLSLALVALFLSFVFFLACTSKNEDVKPAPVSKKSISYSASTLKYTINYSDGTTRAEMHLSENPSYQWYIEKKDGYGTVLGAYYASVQSDVLTLYQNDVAIYSHNIQPALNPPAQAPWPGNCNELGGRRENETFEDCFARNFSNFCCDALGCASLTLFPVQVSAGIALGCATGGIWIPHIQSIYDHENNVYIY